MSLRLIRTPRRTAESARGMRALRALGLSLPLFLALVTGCSSRPDGEQPPTATCSATKPCPAGLVCVTSHGLCALPGPGADDMSAMPPADMTGVPVDMAPGPEDQRGTPADQAMPPADQAVPGDMIAMPGDMRAPPVMDLAMPPIMDLAMPPVMDMAMPADMAVPMPTGTKVCPHEHWCWENPLAQPRDMNAIWGTGPSDIWAVGEYGTALHWNGSAWLQIPTGTTVKLTAVWGRSSSQVWIMGANGTLLFWDGGKFTAQAPGTTSTLTGMWGDSTAVWLVGEGGTVRKWDGSSWTAASVTITSALRAVWGAAANDVWAVGDGGMVCHYGGTSWTCGKEFTGGDCTAMVGISKNNIWVFGNMSTAMQWDGSRWVARSRPSPLDKITAATAFGPNNVRAVSEGGYVLTWNGTMFTTALVSTEGNAMNGIWGSDASNIYTVGAVGEMYRFDGMSFKEQHAGFRDTVTSMWGTSDRDVWVFTNDSRAHHFDGSTWTSTSLVGVGFSVAGRASNDIWVGSDSGRVLHYDGTSWTAMNTRDSTATIYGIFIAAADRIVLASNSSVQFWDGARFTISLMPTAGAYTVWGSGPNDLWIGSGNNCGYFRFDGTRWTGGNISGCSGFLTGIHGTGANDVYFTPSSVTVAYRWDGSKMNTVTLPSSYAKNAVFATASRVFMVTTNGEIVTGRGTTWESTGPVLGTNSLRAIAGFSADKVWVGGLYGHVLSYKP